MSIFIDYQGATPVTIDVDVRAGAHRVERDVAAEAAAWAAAAADPLWLADRDEFQDLGAASLNEIVDDPTGL